MAGSAVTGGLSMAFDNTLRAPHGGIFVVELVGRPVLYLLAIVAGTVVSAVLVIIAKTAKHGMSDQEIEQRAGIPVAV